MITYFGVGPKPATFPRRPANSHHCPSGRMTALALGADGSRMYAGNFAGVWRSDDGGQSWSQLTWPEPPFGMAQADIPDALHAPHVFAPDDPDLVYAVGTERPQNSPRVGVVAISRDAGKSWTRRAVGSSLWHVAVAPREAAGTRRVYAVGDSVIWYSTDGGQSWRTDGGVATIRMARQQPNAFQQSCNPNAGVGGFAGPTAYAGGDAAQILAVEPENPSKVYLATRGGANGPTYHHRDVPDGTLVNTDCRRLAGEASLWLGDFSQFEASGSAQWSQLPGPPVHSGVSTPSGNCYVVTKPTPSGFLLFFADTSHVHVSAGTPTANASWHRLDGMDASESKRNGIGHNRLFIHVDPHAIVFTPDFEIRLKAPSG